MVEDLAGEPHRADRLGLYYLNALDEAEGAAIETHLASCPRCPEVAREIVETVAALEMLTSGDRAWLADGLGSTS